MNIHPFIFYHHLSYTQGISWAEAYFSYHRVKEG